MRAVLISILLLVLPAISWATINGATSVDVNSTETYTRDNGTTYAGGPTWIVSGGNVISSSQNGTEYSVTVQWTSIGGGSLTFKWKTVNVESLSVTVTNYTLYGSGQYCPGSPAMIITLGGSDVGTSYQLYRNGTANGTSKAGTGTSLKWTTTTAGTYTCKTTTSTLMNGSATITVGDTPTVYSLTSPSSYCGGTGSVTLASSQNTMTYFLKRDGVNVGSSVSGTGSALTWSGLTTAGTYTVSGQAGDGCSAAMTGTVIIYTIPGTPTVSAVSNCGAGTVAITGTAGTNGNTIRWYSASSGGSILATGLTYSPSVSTTTTYYASTYNSTSGCESSSRTSVVVTIKTIPDVSATTQADICSGETTGIWISNPNGVAGTTFNWTYSGSNITGGSNGSGSSIAQTLTRTGTAPTANVIYTITPTGNGCTGTPVAKSFNVKLRPTASASPQTICSGNASSISLSSDITPATFAWTNPTQSGVSGGTSGSGSTIAQTLTSASGGTATYSVTATANGCAGTTPTNVIATVNVYNGGTVTVSGNSRFGSGSVVISGSGATSYNWYNSDGSTLLSPGTSTYTATSVGSTNASYGRVKGIGTNGCVDSSYTPYGITIEPLSVVSAASNQVPLGSSLVLSTGSYLNYIWKDQNGLVIGNSQSVSVASPGSYTVTVQKTGITGDGTSLPFSVISYQDTRNYIYSRTIIKSGVTSPSLLGTLDDKDIVRSISYQDGLGRTMQSIGIGQSGDQKDVIAPVAYSKRGLMDTTYLPYVSSAKDGTFRTNAIKFQSGYSSSEQKQFYSSATSQPYAVTVFRDAPDGRLLQQGSTGSAWQPGQHAQSASVTLNSASYPVRYFKPDGTSSGDYPSKSVIVSRMIDENNNEVRTYTNSLGQSVLKQVQVDASTFLDTYFSYDEYGRLKYQMSPNTVYGATPNMETDTQPQEFIYKYKYDGFGRVIEKKKPGAAVEYFIYDKLGRLVLTQDGNLRETNQWYFVKYDMFNRPVYTGIYTNATQTTRSAVQGLFDAIDYSTAPKFEDEAVNATYQGYTNNVFPTSSLTLLTVSYYDHYNFDRSSGDDYTYDNTHLSGIPSTASTFTRGLPTGSKRLILGTSNWLFNCVFYDEYDRPIQVLSNNHLNLGTIDRSSSLYLDLAGHIDKVKVSHNGITASTSIQRYSYDPNWRTTAIYHTLNGASEQQIAAYEYNSMGQLVDKKLHKTAGGTFLQSVDYRYHYHGWLTSINNATLTNDGVKNDDTGDYFGMELYYAESTTLNQTLQYNGNISAVMWKGVGASTGNGDRRAYKYSYDKSDRLLHSKSLTYGTAAWDKEINTINETATYDKNGNIQKLGRRQNQRGLSGLSVTSASQLIDSLTYTYATGNQLSKVEDSSSDIGFVNGTVGGTTEYTYSSFGSLTSDKNKGIDSIKYNELGKVKRIKYTDGRIQIYTYSADGEKLSLKTYSSGGVIQKTTEYANGMQYEDNELRYQPLPEGRIARSGKSMLDNNRLHCASTTDFQALNSSISSVTQNGETYVKVSSGGAGLVMSGAYIARGVSVQASKKYVVKVKGYVQSSSTYQPVLYINANNGVVLWSSSGPMLSKGASNESWVSYEFTTPAGATSIEFGMFWHNTVSVPSGTEFYLNETDLRLVTDEYQYSITDHQGNTRVVFGSMPAPAEESFANMESSNPDFPNDASIFKSSLSIYNHTPGGTYSNLLNGGYSGQVGLAKSFKVYPGDKVKIETYGKYSGNNGVNNTYIAGFASALLSAFGASAPGVGETGTPSSALNQFGMIVAGGNGAPSIGPRAFVNIIIFDKNFNFLDVAFEAIDPAAEQIGVSPVVAHDYMSSEYTVKEAGYAYMYVSNENPTLVDVYFDDVKMTYTPGNVLQYNEYYSFGMRTANSWDRSESGTLVNDYMYNRGSEFNTAASWYETAARGYDPILGRMNGVDPMADKYSSLSPYNYAFNRPNVTNDPGGADPDPDKKAERTNHLMWQEEHAQRMVYQQVRSAGWALSGASRLAMVSSPSFDMAFESTYMSAGGGTSQSAYDFINDALNSAYGGYWRDGRGGYFSSSEQALAYGMAYNDYHDSWNNTEYGNEGNTKFAYLWASATGSLPSRETVMYHMSGRTFAYIPPNGQKDLFRKFIEVEKESKSIRLITMLARGGMAALAFLMVSDEGAERYKMVLGTVPGKPGHSLIGVGTTEKMSWYHQSEECGFEIVSDNKMQRYLKFGLTFDGKFISQDQFDGAMSIIFLKTRTSSYLPYDKMTNSCVTNVKDVMYGAGYNPPEYIKRPSSLQIWWISTP